jgi:hypothetical protein
MILTVIVGVTCFIAGALVFRNNKDDGENLVQKVLKLFKRK